MPVDAEGELVAVGIVVVDADFFEPLVQPATASTISATTARLVRTARTVCL